MERNDARERTNTAQRGTPAQNTSIQTFSGCNIHENFSSFQI
jgi:hypothetical protein